MSAYGTKRTFVSAAVMSAFGGKADMLNVRYSSDQGFDVRFVPCGQLLLYINR
jgi:hypothetical protein